MPSVATSFGLQRWFAALRPGAFEGPVSSLFEFRRVWNIPGSAQLLTVAGLFVATVLLTHAEYVAEGTCFGFPGPAFNVLINPIYEELVFRGWILGALARRQPWWAAIGGSSLLFGLFHLRNLYWLDAPDLFGMMASAALFTGPLLGYVTLRCRSVWPAVILHYLNNLTFYLRG